MSPEDRAEVSPAWLERVRAATSPDPWLHGYALVHRGTGGVIGSAGFKAPPDSAKAVEIAYGVSPEHENLGYATEAAQALAAWALGSGEVETVLAHTRSESGASARVLAKCGFRRIGPVMDPEDGRSGDGRNEPGHRGRKNAGNPRGFPASW